MSTRRWWNWLTDITAVVAGSLATAAMILGLGWGVHGGWRLIPAAAVGLTVATVGCELPSTPMSAESCSTSADTGQRTDGPDDGRRA